MPLFWARVYYFFSFKTSYCGFIVGFYPWFFFLVGEGEWFCKQVCRWIGELHYLMFSSFVLFVMEKCRDTPWTLFWSCKYEFLNSYESFSNFLLFDPSPKWNHSSFNLHLFINTCDNLWIFVHQFFLKIWNFLLLQVVLKTRIFWVVKKKLNWK